MRILLSFLLLFSVSQFGYTQEDKGNLAVDVQVNQTPFKNLNLLGLGFSANYYILNNFSLGGAFQFTSQKFPFGMGYETDRTSVHIFDFQIVPQLDLYKNNRWSLGVQLRNGIKSALLYDRNQIIKEELGFIVDDFLFVTESKSFELIETDNYYILAPQLTFSYKLSSLDPITNLYASMNVGYQFAFGNGAFTTSNDFRNYIVSLGFVIKGGIED